ncbi:hypothetical protein RHODO2019_11445 [Rhodococcus antarcticus]|jgi:hypothetical protein|uniref:Oxalate:formate antiporter n=1 Tax=Rhodococcus antarcticus TaxID=2987751 RepID=A0ABY6NWP1_9NOCA|nr:hypothetical protein [Rhodococcus antarcticus]UZJ23815.1 hypothetical protein RHODO2019_11445 [Rhodococcus antarcticus]
MSTNTARDTTGAAPAVVVVVAWLWVLLPFAYGVYELVLKVKNLFG